MKAISIEEFGGPEVMQLREVDRPCPAADEILVKVYASGVNPADYTARKGGNEFMRPLLSLPLTLGWDAAGTVEEVGADVTDFTVGQAVYGMPNFPGNGSYAEYAVGKASQFAPKPESISFNAAAAVPLVTYTAWTGLLEDGELTSGQRILIHGASGGVGSAAVQLAKWKGAYVIGTASAHNQDYLKEIGADETIDYNNQRFEEEVKDIDVVFDASPAFDDSVLLRSVKVLKPGGRIVSTNPGMTVSDEFQAALDAKSATIHKTYGKANGKWLAELVPLINDGRFRVTVSKVYPLAEVQAAHRESEAGHVRGKLVLEIGKENE